MRITIKPCVEDQKILRQQLKLLAEVSEKIAVHAGTGDSEDATHQLIEASNAMARIEALLTGYEKEMH